MSRGAGGARSPDVDPPFVAVADAVTTALAEDLLPLGDLTASLVDPALMVEAVVVARAPGVLAGRMCATETFRRLDPAVAMEWRRRDGDDFAAGSALCELSGSLRAMLSAERTALNFLCHLSGVATLTRRFVDVVRAANPATRVLDTRKTTPGLRALEKAAVRAGGGTNHRGNLSEAVLVKDNHLAGLTITDAVSTARHFWPGRMIEVECDGAEQVEEAVAAGATLVLLDNMSPEEVSRCVELVRAGAAKDDLPAGVAPGETCPLVEVSGGVTIEGAPLFAAVGADFISVGALTHSAPVVDLGLDLRG